MQEYISRNIDKELIAWIWMFMREKHLTEAFRCSLENYGEFEYIDKEDDNATRHVTILPLYALSQLRK